MRDRLRSCGAGSLSDRELLAVLLGPSRSEGGTEALLRELLPTGTPLSRLVDRVAEDLARSGGLGEVRAGRIEVAMELARRIASGPRRGTRLLDHPERVQAALAPRFALALEEHVVVLLLDARHRMLGERSVSRGSLMASVVHPREVFRPALRLSAASLILVHNHPSGDPTPSAEDHEVTERIAMAGTILGIPLLDHVVVAADGYWSFRERGLLERRGGNEARSVAASTLGASARRRRSPRS